MRRRRRGNESEARWGLPVRGRPRVRHVAAAQERTPTAITDIRQESSDQATRLVLESTGPLLPTRTTALTRSRSSSTSPDVDASAVPARINVGTREVESVRVTSLARADGRNLARVEVRLASLAPYQVFSRTGRSNLVFERPTRRAPAAPAPAPSRLAAARRGPRARPPAAAGGRAAGPPPRDGRGSAAGGAPLRARGRRSILACHARRASRACSPSR